MTERVTLQDDTAYQDLWTSCQDVLRRHLFNLDRVDPRAGVIVTHPVTSQHITEFWRHDVDTSYDLWESTLNPIRRRVTVQFSRPEASICEVTVTVDKQRLASPERQFTNSAAAFQFFGETLPGVAGQPRITAADEYWINIGRDPAMESYLLGRFLAQTPPEPEVT